MPVGATPALAITTSMPPKRSTAASTAPLECVHVGHVGLERGGLRGRTARPRARAPRAPAPRAPRSRPARGELARALRADSSRRAGDQDGPAAKSMCHSSPTRPLASSGPWPRSPTFRRTSAGAGARSSPRAARCVWWTCARHGSGTRAASPARATWRWTASPQEADSLAGDPPVVFYCRTGAPLGRGHPGLPRIGTHRLQPGRRAAWRGWSGVYRSSPTTAPSRSTNERRVSWPSYGPRPVRQAAPQRAPARAPPPGQARRPARR